MRLMLLCVLAALLMSGCHVLVRETGVEPPLVRDWPIRIRNDTGEVFDVALDGAFLATITPHTHVQTLALEGPHVLEAWDTRGSLRARREFYLDSDFVWVLEP